MAERMTEREKLNFATKADLIDAILDVHDQWLIRRINISIVANYKEKMDVILTKMEECDLKTATGRAKYRELEARYEKLEKTFDRLCGI